MSLDITLRYLLEISLFVPAMIFAVIPVTEYLRVKPAFALIPSALVMAVMIFAGAYFGVYNKIRVRIIAVPIAIIVFAIYMIIIDTEAGKKLFCFSNALMLCAMCPMYTILINAPRELLNFSGVFTYSSGFISLAVSAILGVIFCRTLTVKIPILLKEDSIRDVWRYMFLVPLGMSALIYWMIPLSPVVVMTGRVRPINMLFITIIGGGILFLYHLFWWTTSRLTENAKLQQENGLLNMEHKRYSELRKYMDETRALRHDFRQHIFVMSELSDNERITELKAYISQLAEKASRKSPSSFCANMAVDAVASHYDRLAETEGAKISWSLEIPHTLPMNEPEYCAILGNLIENALNAVKPLPPEERRVKVISSMLSDAMLGLSVDNNYSGSISFGKNGLPVSNQRGHGTGLLSVMNTVNHYGGTMDIRTEGNIFSVNIIMYCYMQEK
ncbi:MAG: sensor histidine kinase [Synergistaceae bacterium]|nr:sensor histidine kinase [Synergistaceae bacterium]MBQ6666074.1 sensor histidine kinase [Synergistaceae bacterium]